MHLRPSRILRQLRAGGVATCTKSNLADPRVMDIIGMTGFDSVWSCMEHVPNTIRDVEQLISAAKIHDMDAVVRVPRGSYSELIRPLEADASAIMVPHVMNGEDAQRLVHQTRFHPLGRRPLDNGNADGRYCTAPLDEYIAHANRERLIIAQIEDPEAIEDLERIVSTEGLDVLFFGASDYAHALGVPGRGDDPRGERAREQVVDAAQRHGK